MDRDTALELLSAPNYYVRLRAARILTQTALSEDLEKLKTARLFETVTWVQQALDDAIERAGGAVKSFPVKISAPAQEEEEQLLIDDVNARAVRTTARKLVHDVKRFIGYVNLEASQEITDYQTSRTKQEVDRLRLLMQAIEKLSESAAVPNIQQFDISKLIKDTATAECSNTEVVLELSGTCPELVYGDDSLIQLILTSAICNAVEAVTDVKAVIKDPTVVVSWGQTDREYWISIIDNGSGPPPKGEGLFDIGTTTKRIGHFGLGLAQAKTAALSLRGEIGLDVAALGGAKFSFSWPKPKGKIL